MTEKHKAAIRRGIKRAARKRARTKPVPPGEYKAEALSVTFDKLTGNVTTTYRLRGKGLGSGGRKIENTLFNVQPPLKVEKVAEQFKVSDELVADDVQARAETVGQSLANTSGGVAIGRELLDVQRPVLDLDMQATDALKTLGDRFDLWRAAQKRFEETDPRDPQFLPYASQATVAFLMYSEAARRAQNTTSPTARPR